MDNVMSAEQVAEILRAEHGIDTSAQGVRWHARKGRAGRRVSGVWVFTREDVSKILAYAGKPGPRPQQLSE